MKISVVLGLGFGDEGKGLTTSYLVSQSNWSPNKILVTRFQGGHQAGHTVVHEGRRHVFSSFGSGTLQGCDTYWTKHCTFYPIAFLNERTDLGDTGTLYLIDALTPIVTPYDLLHNQAMERQKQHGSVGVGFGTTLKRQEDYYKLHFADLLYDAIVRQKLKAISEYYHGITLKAEFMDEFLEAIATIRQLVLHKQIMMITHPERHEKVFSKYMENIFEGAQGILLDMDHGFFPNVTRSNTTSKNVGIILNDMGQTADRSTAIWYVTRSYQTRHGNGFMTNEGTEHITKPNPLETNVQNTYQGKFRKGMLDLELLKHAINCDRASGVPGHRNLMITCLDQTDGVIRFTSGQPPYEATALPDEFIDRHLGIPFQQIKLSYGDSWSAVV